jgi:phosphomannomutase
MANLIEEARAWVAGDPDPSTRSELESVIARGDSAELESRMGPSLEFGTAGIRGEVGAGPGRMNRAVVIRTTHGLARHLQAKGGDGSPGRVVVGFDARPDSRRFAEDTAGVLAAAGIPVLYFPSITPTPLVAYAAKHLSAAAAVVVTASHNPPADNGYKVYGSEASQIVSPMDHEIQEQIEAAPDATDVPRIEDVFSIAHPMVATVPDDILDCYWDEISATRSRQEGSDLAVIYTPMHGVGRDTVFEVMRRAGHTGLTAVPEQAEPDGTFPTVAFPNPEEPGALDLAIALGGERDADLVLANDPDADRLAVVVPVAGEWRALTGNEIGILLGDYLLRNDSAPQSAIVASSIVSSPMLTTVASSYGARHEQTLTGFKWIVKAGLSLEVETGGRFIFGYEEALGYTVGSTVRDKDGISAAVLFTDLVADLRDSGGGIMDRLHELWRAHGLWVSAQTSITAAGPGGVDVLRAAVSRLGDEPPSTVSGIAVTGVTDYRRGVAERRVWLGEQALVELTLGDQGRLLVRPSGTEPKLKVYVDLRGDVGADPDEGHTALKTRAVALGRELAGSLGL